MKEFRKFIAKGNVFEMAVGLVMGLYFGAIVKSLVDHILMPPIGFLLGGVDFSRLKLVLKPAVAESAAGAGDAVAGVAIYYGLFINTILTFLIVAIAIFWLVKAYNRMKVNMEKKEGEAVAVPPEPTAELKLLSEIRDLLKKQ